MKVQQLLSELTVYFDGAQAVAGAPLYGGAETLAKRFDFHEVVPLTSPEGAPLWFAKQGREGAHCVRQAWGNESELNVALDITQGERKPGAARGVLDKLWAYLCQRSDLGMAPPLEEVGSLVDGTLAIVEVDRSFEQVLPAARHMREAVLGHLGKGLLDSPVASNLAFRFSLDVNLTVGHRLVPRKLTIEPKITARPNLHVLYTQSPLPFEQHLAMLKLVLGEGGSLP
jgi:hypothetical protein